VKRSPERRPPSLAEVDLIAAAIEPRYRMLVLLAAWSGLRWGELAALTRQRLDPPHGLVHVVEAMVQTRADRSQIGPPKTAAGRRTVAIPPHLWPAIEQHLATFVGPEPAALVFTKANGSPLDRSNFHRHWHRALRATSLPSYHFHDLRHLAATMATVSGATTRELMRRMGHSSQRAALIYQHAAEDPRRRHRRSHEQARPPSGAAATASGGRRWGIVSGVVGARLKPSRRRARGCWLNWSQSTGRWGSRSMRRSSGWSPAASAGPLSRRCSG
jgi:integrase